MDIAHLNQLERTGGPVLEKYRRLRAAADRSLHNSREEKALLEFQRDYQQDAAAVTAAAEADAAK
jgi:hypothetical protein